MPACVTVVKFVTRYVLIFFPRFPLLCMKPLRYNSTIHCGVFDKLKAKIELLRGNGDCIDDFCEKKWLPGR